MPLWVISFGLSRLFATTKFETLWEALRPQNIINQFIWVLPRLCHHHTNVIRYGASDNKTSDIFSGVPKRCVLSQRFMVGLTVNGETCMPHWAAWCSHTGKIVKLQPVFTSARRTPKVQTAVNTMSHDPLHPCPMQYILWCASGMKSYSIRMECSHVQLILEYTHTTNPGGRLRPVIIGNWRATLRTSQPILWQHELYNGKRVRTGRAGDRTHGSQKLRNLRGGSGATTGKRLPCATVLCGSN